MTIKGLFTRASVTLDLAGDDPGRWVVRAAIDAASIDSGHERRDEVLRAPDFLDAERFPTIEYRSTRIARQGGGGDEWGPYRVEGELTLHGVARPVALDLVYQGEATGSRGQQYRVFTTRATVNRVAHGVGKPLAPGSSGVAEEIVLSLQIELVWEE
jgi:polyisoprenoid-binding protein YceI